MLFCWCHGTPVCAPVFSFQSQTESTSAFSEVCGHYVKISLRELWTCFLLDSTVTCTLFIDLFIDACVCNWSPSVHLVGLLSHKTRQKTPWHARPHNEATVWPLHRLCVIQRFLKRRRWSLEWDMRFTFKTMLLYLCACFCCAPKEVFFTLDAVNLSASGLFICPPLSFPALAFSLRSSDSNHLRVAHTSLERGDEPMRDSGRLHDPIWSIAAVSMSF